MRFSQLQEAIELHREHQADRAAVVRQALDAAGMLTPDVERMAADVLSPDGLPRFVWTDDKPDPTTYTLMLLRAVAERQRLARPVRPGQDGWGCGQSFGNRTTERRRTARPGACPQLGLTRSRPNQGRRADCQG
jgi:hypothetical protein